VKDLPPCLGNAAGAQVADVASGGPAKRAGVRAGAAMTTVQGHAICNASQLRWSVSNAGMETEVGLAVRHPGEVERTLRVALAQVPGAGAAPGRGPAGGGGVTGPALSG